MEPPTQGGNKQPRRSAFRQCGTQQQHYVCRRDILRTWLAPMLGCRNLWQVGTTMRITNPCIGAGTMSIFTGCYTTRDGLGIIASVVGDVGDGRAEVSGRSVPPYLHGPFHYAPGAVQPRRLGGAVSVSPTASLAVPFPLLPPPPPPPPPPPLTLLSC